MYMEQLMAGMGMHQKMLSNDAHIIYYQKRQCTDMYMEQLMAGMGMHQYMGKNAF
jgi:hypothetical protein